MRTIPFILADLPLNACEDADGAPIRYTTGRNNSGTHQDEVLQLIRTPDGHEAAYVIMRGLSRAKAQAIVMILNAPEEG